MRVLSFRVSGKFAHFRKFYTTTSPLTFQIPPYTVIKGLVAAMLGLPKDSYNEEFNTMKIGLQVLSNVTKKKMFGMNYLDTRSPMTFGDYIQVKRETIIAPSYRIFIADEGFARFDEFKNNMLTQTRVYSPYLGVAEFGASIDEINLVQAEQKAGSHIHIDSIIPLSHTDGGKSLVLHEEQQFEFEKVPYQMDDQRNLLALQEFVYDPTGGCLTLKKADCWQVGEYRIFIC